MFTLVDPSQILRAIVERLQDVPPLLKELRDEKKRIRAYYDAPPESTSLVEAIHAMPVPGILIVWQGSSPGAIGSFETVRHTFSIYLRAGDSVGDPDQFATGYYRLWRLICEGDPENIVEPGTVDTKLPLWLAQIHPGCDPLESIPAISRQTDADGFDFFEMQLSFNENGRLRG